MWQYYENLSTDSDNLSQNASIFVSDIDKLTLKFIWKSKIPE